MAPTIDLPDGLHPSSLIGVLIFIADLIAVIQLINSDRSLSAKILWSLLIFLFPIIGLIIYLLYTHNERRRLRYISIP
ncbi:hypothetical protein BCR41DRAFT_347538 [Lobosporangium transversale]|uniref:Cardiolipin synthase N-terminal domain-containing protein n=1 Tax=Lobosporangium transversale TaxID=64571 RepID=A0A1Y2GW77_9FUNG|nr:hypothetical protein BCR41DRAFT_347538 [Lobosporangium transversale]ORZ26560.1 hypothetical protein BCR41DRAFT_347538 [Lobosporangium transversale]|eukprot:XP_021884323.1 hypothetical protein BCR41DRAFT_347538 [Lobosporangium transversale]